MNHILSHDVPVEEVISKNRYGIRNLEAKYLQNEYQKMQNSKNAQRMAKLAQKQKDMHMLKTLNKTYLDEVHQNRKKKLKQMETLSMEYDDFMRNRQQKQKIDKLIQKNIQNSTLSSPTWIRDVFTQRSTYKKNIQSYSKALADHVKLQQMRKDIEKDEENYYKQKVNQEADAILKKDIEELQARHRQKSMFQQRQNKLLGIQSETIDMSSSKCQPFQTTLKRKQQQLYGQGLSVQLRKEQDRKYSQDKMALNNSNVYNPITNPIPFIYKNPNVLRMMANN